MEVGYRLTLFTITSGRQVCEVTALTPAFIDAAVKRHRTSGLFNELRLQAGKSALGLLNPLTAF